MASSDDTTVRALTELLDELVLGVDDESAIERGEGVTCDLLTAHCWTRYTSLVGIGSVEVRQALKKEDEGDEGDSRSIRRVVQVIDHTKHAHT
jgi:hypothetical protein